jgi:hypothetical protein
LHHPRLAYRPDSSPVRRTANEKALLLNSVEQAQAHTGQPLGDVLKHLERFSAAPWVNHYSVYLLPTTLQTPPPVTNCLSSLNKESGTKALTTETGAG